MPSQLNTGVPLAGGTVNSPGYEQQSENLLFGPLSNSLTSHKFTVHESPILLRAFNLDEQLGIVYVDMVTNVGVSEITSLMYVNQRAVGLTYNRNVLLIDMPGEYRLRTLNSGTLGTFTVVAQTTAMSYWSWGLAAYGNSVDPDGSFKLEPDGVSP